MKGENDLARIGIHIHNDLVDQGSKEVFLQAHIRFRTAPHCLQFARQILKMFACGCGSSLPVTMDMLFDPKLDLLYTLQGLVPATFQFVFVQAAFHTQQ
jgi:hypothetical protein